MGEERAPDRLVFPSSRTARAVARVIVVAAVVAFVVSVGANGFAGLSVAVVCAPLAGLALAVRRMNVTAEPHGLAVCGGWRTRLIPWSRIDRFVVESGMGERGVMVVLNSDEIIRLPVANGTPGISRRREVARIRDALAAYAEDHR